MKTLYMKPLSMDRLMDLSELVALYKNTTNDIINIADNNCTNEWNSI